MAGKFFYIIFFLVNIMSGTVFAALQTISISPSNLNVTPNGIVEFSIIYDSSSPRNSMGLGIQLFFDSSQLTFISTSAVYSNDNVGIISDINDTTDIDGNTSTDKMIPAGWSDITGNWPTTTGNITLYKVKFSATSNFSENTTINMRGNSAIGHTFTQPATPTTVTSTPSSSATPKKIPTLSEWGIIFLSLMLLLVPLQFGTYYKKHS